MKITHNKVGQNLNLVDSAKGEKTGKADKVSAGKDDVRSLAALDKNDEAPAAARVEVSSRAKEASKIKELAMAAPDVDAQKVAKFKKLIDEGAYKVDAKAVADRMVDEHLSMAGANRTEE